jgi:RNA polymerase sigma-70 factor, ECF subfamily
VILEPLARSIYVAQSSVDATGLTQAGLASLPAVAHHREEEVEDDSLVRAALADSAAFDELYARYMPRVYRFCRTRTSTEEDAADLTQLTFIRAFSALRRYRVGSKGFAPWLFRIACNAATDAHRRRRLTLPLDAIADLPSHPTTDPAARALANDELAGLRRALATLRPDVRDLITLHFTVGLTVREVAAVVGKSESATRMQLWRTLRALREETQR